MKDSIKYFIKISTVGNSINNLNIKKITVKKKLTKNS